MKRIENFRLEPSHAWAVFSALLILTGCSPSKTADNAPAEIRGQPIEAAVPPVATASAAPAPPNPAVTSEVPLAPTAPAVAGLTPAVPSAGESATVAAKDGEATVINFDKLASFEFIMPEESISTNVSASASSKSNDQIPATIKALNQERVALKGFMLPLKVEAGLVTEMLIMRDQSMCCYGKTPKITEWVSVKMNEKGVKAVMDQPVTILGKLHVGEMRENGYLVGIYRMDGDGMKAAE